MGTGRLTVVDVPDEQWTARVLVGARVGTPPHDDITGTSYTPTELQRLVSVVMAPEDFRWRGNVRIPGYRVDLDEVDELDVGIPANTAVTLNLTAFGGDTRSLAWLTFARGGATQMIDTTDGPTTLQRDYLVKSILSRATSVVITPPGTDGIGVGTSNLSPQSQLLRTNVLLPSGTTITQGARLTAEFTSNHSLLYTRHPSRGVATVADLPTDVRIVSCLGPSRILNESSMPLYTNTDDYVDMDMVTGGTNDEDGGLKLTTPTSLHSTIATVTTPQGDSLQTPGLSRQVENAVPSGAGMVTSY